MKKDNSYSHLENEYQLKQRAILIEFYGEMAALKELHHLEKYDPQTTNERMERIIHDSLNKLKGLEYEHDAILDARTDRI